MPTTAGLAPGRNCPERGGTAAADTRPQFSSTVKETGRIISEVEVHRSQGMVGRMGTG